MPVIFEDAPGVVGASAALSDLSGPAPLPDPNADPGPDALDVVASAFVAENTLSMALDEGTVPTFAPDETYNPFGDEAEIAGYEQHAAAFADSRSREETAYIKTRVDRMRRAKKTVDEGGWLGVVSTVAAGAVDPIMLPLMFLPGGALSRGAGIAKQAASAAAIGGASEVLIEGVKAQMDPSRTMQESLFNIGGATILSGVLGGAVAGLSRSQFDVIAKELDDQLREGLEGAAEATGAADGPLSVGAAQARTFRAADTELVSTGIGIERIGVTPELRLANSPSKAAREAMFGTVESSLFTRGAEDGVAVAGDVGAIETRIKRYDAPKGEAFEELDRLFLEHRQTGGMAARLRTGLRDLASAPAEGQLTRRQFSEQVAHALRNGDEHAIPQVAQAAKRMRELVFDPPKKAAQELGLLPEDVKVRTAPSYLTRVWNHERIKARRPEFEQRLARWMQREGADAGEVADAAAEIVDNILGAPGGRITVDIMPKKLNVSKAGPLKERVLLIPDRQIEDFLENDVEVIASHYLHKMAPDIEIARTWGDKDMKDAFQGIVDDYVQLREKVAADPKMTPKQKEKAQAALDKQRMADVRDLEAIRDRLIGTYRAPDDPDSFFMRANRNILGVNYMSKLGGMTLSALPDAARVVATAGVRPLARSFAGLITSPKRFGMMAREIKAAGTAWDMVLNTRGNAIAELSDAYGRGSAVERGFKAMQNNFGVVSLMAPWNAKMKQFAGVTIQSEMARTIKRIGAGAEVGKKQIQKLAVSGISPDMARRIAVKLEQFGEEEGGLILARPDLWGERDLIDAWRSAIVKDVDRTIVTPGVGDRPLWMSSPTGKMLGQFKSFGFAANQKVLISGLQQRDAAVASSALLMLGLGAVTYALKSYTAGKEPSTDPGKWVTEAIDRSGMLGYLGEVNGIVEKLSSGRVGLSAMTGQPALSRFQSRNILGALIGPTAGTIQDASQAINAAATGEWSESDVHALRKMLPYQNLFYLRKLFDQIEGRDK